MFNFNEKYEYVVMIDGREVSFEYFGNNFREAVQVISDIKKVTPTAWVRYFHNGKEIPLI